MSKTLSEVSREALELPEKDREALAAALNMSLNPEEGYDDWVRARVQEALDDPRPSIAHEEVVARVQSQLLNWSRLKKEV